MRFVILLVSLFCLVGAISAQEGHVSRIISGTVTDPQAKPASNLRVLLFGPQGAAAGDTMTDGTGLFSFRVPLTGFYTLKVSAPPFEQVTRSVQVGDAPTVNLDIHLGRLSKKQELITVTADVKESSILFPDPAQRVFIRQEMLDANPGRPGAPISIPGLPIETASGGIKAPQYFAPGVAGDHGAEIWIPACRLRRLRG
jgi:hypothetical protein